MAPTRTPVSPANSKSRAVRGSRSGRPVMALLDLLGKRWTLRVLWELREGRRSFRSLQEACDSVSPAVLNARLRELRDGALIDLAAGEGYGLSALGRELLDRFLPVVIWADRWAKVAAKVAAKGVARGVARVAAKVPAKGVAKKTSN